ncbi:DinB family protein [Spirosoma sp. SC4-14]|uniref:DinB family protein n=1 Tax=Spirosoma sp. SC4-14 TaxID=3128900 RepID=UPI0030D28712
METVERTLEQRLADDGRDFIEVATALTDDQFKQNVDGKWSVAEVMQHLYLSARPVARLMTGPREVFEQWGKTDASPKRYDDIAKWYQTALKNRNQAPSAMSPRPDDMQVDKAVILERFMSVYQTLCEAIPTWSDNELNSLQIPHPLLGLLSVREMLYFTSVHTQHHLRLLPVL